ncbi:MAG: SPOR domain-containing protein [Gammaproteobacteria bacterium]|nr:SPOR domain-containing protein [Gammaproteobacteria bacterium]
MTRAVTYLLLLANAGIVLWQVTLGSESGNNLPQRDSSVKLLMLLSEQKNSGSTRAAVAISGSATPREPGEACFTLGPFRSQDGAARAREALQGLRLKPTGRVRNEREQYGFQVYLPPLGSREAAIDAARELADKGITEYYIMNEKNLRNAISLGLFRSKAHASRQVERLKEIGVFVEILPRYRDRKLYWLDYNDAGQALNDAAIRQFFPDDPVQRLTRSCG